MKTLLGTAAGLMVATGAYAADLPGEAAPVAVDYVKVCDAYGAGFFYIPGTETCLRVKGRVRAGVTYTNNGGDLNNGRDTVRMRTDAYVGFDARTASDIGVVRSYFEIGIDDETRDILANQAFIQVGYVTVGRQDEVANGDGLYGINDSTWEPGDYTATGASVLVDNLGGGFFIGAGLYGNNDTQEDTLNRPYIWQSGEEAEYQASGIIGITGQSWGSFDVSGIYRSYDDDLGVDGDIWGVKATANLKLVDKLSLRVWAAYQDGGDGVNLANIAGFRAENVTDLAIAASYQFSDPLAVYAGVRYQIVDGVTYNRGTTANPDVGKFADDLIYANVGVDYELAPGLNLQGELDYASQDDWNQFTAVTRLVRVW
ncbi:porin [Pleomorphomonas carboxyditropha]|nr:porin [Pleomorphomonas carboxyditropha]